MLKWHWIIGQGMRCHFTLQTLITSKRLQQKCNSYQRRMYYDTWKKAEDFTGTELAKESPGRISKQESARSSFYLPKKSTNQASTQIASHSAMVFGLCYHFTENLVLRVFSSIFFFFVKMNKSFRKTPKGCLENDFCQNLSTT